ncbi:MAG: hypothetical protein ACE3JK_01580 [Sporolactobacillus sp.]
MLQTIISSGLTDAVKAVITVAGGFCVVYIKHHIDLAKIKKAEAFVQSKPALEKLVEDIKAEIKELIASPETIDNGASVIAEYAQKKGFKVTKEQVANLLTTGEKEVSAEAKEVAQEVQQPAPGSNAVQSPTTAQKA